MAKFRIGHTGITWGFNSTSAKQAIKDTAELGYLSFETFGSVVDEYRKSEPGGFGAVLRAHNLLLSAVYCPTVFYDPVDAPSHINETVYWAKLGRDLGASAVVLEAGRRKEQPYTMYAGMAEAFNEIGRRVKEMGLITAIHPHTGTLVETRAEIDTILSAVDPALVGFAPDTGQIAKGGGDPVATLRDHKSQIQHVHLKDYAGGRKTAHGGYAPIGSGVIDMAGIFAVFEEAGFSGWVNVELDGPPALPLTSRDVAAMSMGYLRGLLRDRAAW